MDKWENPDDKKRYMVNRMHIIKHIGRRIVKRGKMKRIPPVLVKCDFCGKPIKVKPSRLRYYKNHFCGRIHHGLYKRKINQHLTTD